MILAPNQDAQGRAMYDYYRGNRDVFEIIERDDGFIEAYAGPRDYLSPFKKLGPSSESVNSIRQRPSIGYWLRRGETLALSAAERSRSNGNRHFTICNPGLEVKRSEKCASVVDYTGRT